MKADKDFGTICLCALRYCFGRRTYMPSLVTDFIKRNWQYVSRHYKEVLMTEIHEALEKHDPNSINPFYNLGSVCDIKTYRDFLDWMKEQK